MADNESATLQDWIGELTAAGFDIMEMGGHTTRGDGWNSNHPIPTIAVLMSRDKQDITIKAYATNSRRWTVYGTLYKGKATMRRWGFTVRGTKEVSLEYDQLGELG